MSTAAGRLAGRRVLITGAASGIGRATAELAVAAGAAVALLDVQAAALAAVGEATGGFAIECNLKDRAATEAAVEEAADRLGGLDGVVNAAGVASRATLEETDLDVWDEVIAVNLTAPFVVCRSAARWLRRAPGVASIVNVASGQALLPNSPGGSSYAASKAGVTNLTRSLAAELAPAVRANVVCPGVVDTPMTSFIFEGYDSPDDAPFVQQYALRRVARPEELAAVIVFLLSDDASYVTGSVLAADGGRTFH